MHFQKKDFIKIGITKSIAYRVEQIEKAFQLTVDHHKTLIITDDKKGRISTLEKHLLDITNDFSIKVNAFKKTRAGQSEFRKNNCLNLINQYINDQRDYGIYFKIYQGLDVCGQYNITIPKIYYPIYYPVRSTSKVLYGDVVKYCRENKILIRDFINEALYSKLQDLGLAKKDESENLYKNYFKARKTRKSKR